MKKEHLNNVNPDELIKGIDLVLNNANALIEEGNILLKHKKHSRAYALYQLAIEEVGKSQILFSLIMKLKLGKEINYKELNRDFTEHTKKSKSSIVFEVTAILLMNRNTPKDEVEKRAALKEMLDDLNQEKQNVNLLNDNKNNSLYTNVVDDKFVTPEMVVSDQMAAKMKEKANIRLHASRPLLMEMLQGIDQLCDYMKQHPIDEIELPDELIDLFSN